MMPPIIGVRADCAEAALSKFKEAGFEPDQVTTTDDEVRYQFKDVPDSQLFALASAIPVEFYSKHAVIGDLPSEKN